MFRDNFVKSDTNTAILTVDLIKNVGLGLWNLATTVFYTVSAICDLGSGISTTVLDNMTKPAEHFSDAKQNITEATASVIKVSQNLANIALDFTGIACDVVEGITWAGATVISSTQTLCSNFMGSQLDTASISDKTNVEIENIFFDASDSLLVNKQSLVIADILEMGESMSIAGEVFESFTE